MTNYEQKYELLKLFIKSNTDAYYKELEFRKELGQYPYHDKSHEDDDTYPMYNLDMIRPLGDFIHALYDVDIRSTCSFTGLFLKYREHIIKELLNVELEDLSVIMFFDQFTNGANIQDFLGYLLKSYNYEDYRYACIINSILSGPIDDNLITECNYLLKEE